MPTNLERAIARNLQARAERDFMSTMFFGCIGLCLIHLLVAIESPMFAAALRFLQIG